MQIGKLFKWCASAVRLVSAKLKLGSKLQLPMGGKPVYIGRGVRLVVSPGGVMVLGRGVYIDDRSRLQVSAGAHMELGEGCYLNTNCRIVAADTIYVGAHTMFGPNSCAFDHDHIFDAEGVRGELKSAPIKIGDRCWVGANALITKGVAICDRVCVGGGSVVTRSLLEPGVYAGSPARLIRRTSFRDDAINGVSGSIQEDGARGSSSQGAQRYVVSACSFAMSRGTDGK